MSRDTKYEIGPPLAQIGPKSDHYFPWNQTKIGPKCDKNCLKSDQGLIWLKTKVETKLLYPYWWSHTTCVYSSQDKFGDRKCTDSLLTLSRTTVLQQYCTKSMLILSKTLKIGLLSAKSDLSRTNLLQKLWLRTKVRENWTFLEDFFHLHYRSLV